MTAVALRAPTEGIRAALVDILLASGERRTVVRLRRRSSRYSSTWPIDNLWVTLDDGSTLDLVLKDLSPRGMLDEALGARPDLMPDPRRELEVYESVLPAGAVESARFYGSVVDIEHNVHWIFLERVRGLQLCHVGDFREWERAAQWLGRAHRSLVPVARRLARRETSLLRYNGVAFAAWLDAARRIGGPELNGLLPTIGRAIDRVAGLPTTVVHGDLFAANVLLERRPQRRRVCPVDWELSGIGPGLLDLAALASGSWSEHHRSRLLAAYLDAFGGWPARAGDPTESLACCQLLVAIRVLVWSEHWSPPSSQSNDWMGEVRSLCEVL